MVGGGNCAQMLDNWLKWCFFGGGGGGIINIGSYHIHNNNQIVWQLFYKAVQHTMHLY